MKIIPKAIISIMLILLMGCSEINNINKENAQEIESINQNLICTNLDQVKDNIKFGIENLNNEVNFTYKGDNLDITQRVMQVIEKLIEENGEYGLLVNKYETNTTSFSYKSKIKILFQYNLTKEEYSKVKDKVDLVISEIINPGMLDFEKEKAINDWIVTNIEYDNTKKKANIYTALFEGKTVCSGYAHLSKLMLDKANIQNKLVVGEGNREKHAWNMVCIYGNWYHLDTTWNDPSYENLSNKVSYDYFNATDEFMNKTHLWDRKLYPIANSNYEGIRKETMLSLDDIKLDEVSLPNFDSNTHEYYLDANKVRGKSIMFIPRSSEVKLNINKFSNKWEVELESEEYEDKVTYILYFN